MIFIVMNKTSPEKRNGPAETKWQGQPAAHRLNNTSTRAFPINYRNAQMLVAQLNTIVMSQRWRPRALFAIVDLAKL